MKHLNPKVIALSCSPSHGRNSDTMLDSFIEGLRTHENIIVEKIYIDSIQIDPYCFENGTGPQEHETAFEELTEKIKNSQGLVIATPTYNFSVPAHLKNFIDRIRFFTLDLNQKNIISQPTGLLHYLKTYFLVSGGTPSWAQKILFFAFPPFWLRSVFLYYNSVCLGAYYTGDTCSYQNQKIQNKCKKEGIRYGKKLIKNARNPILEQLFWRPPQKN
jgi:multimeric flavodoxin WrbA